MRRSWVDRHHLQTGQLFGRFHQAYLGKVSAEPASSGKQQGGLPLAPTAAATGQPMAPACLRPEFDQYVIALQAQHHADKQPRDQNDQDGPHPDPHTTVAPTTGNDDADPVCRPEHCEAVWDFRTAQCPQTVDTMLPEGGNEPDDHHSPADNRYRIMERYRTIRQP